MVQEKVLHQTITVPILSANVMVRLGFFLRKGKHQNELKFKWSRTIEMVNVTPFMNVDGIDPGERPGGVAQDNWES